jgi:ParB-like chromosome segregation protein Spo0J
LNIELKNIKISKLKANPNNPRVLKDHKFRKLVKSLKEFPEMKELREIVCDENLIVLGGNMRLKALKEIGEDTAIVKIVEGLTEEQKKEFIVKDNLGYGDWDFDALANEYDIDVLVDWGFEENQLDIGLDYSDKNKELNIEQFENGKYHFKLEYSIQDYELLQNKLKQSGETAEQIFYNALIQL